MDLNESKQMHLKMDNDWNDTMVCHVKLSKPWGVRIIYYQTRALSSIRVFILRTKSRSSNHTQFFLGKERTSIEWRRKKLGGHNLNKFNIYIINRDKCPILNICKFKTTQTIRTSAEFLFVFTPGFLFEGLNLNLTHNPKSVLWIILKSNNENSKSIFGLNSPLMLDVAHLSSFYSFFLGKSHFCLP